MRSRYALEKSTAGCLELTVRQAEVLEFVAQGFTNREIGARLGVIEQTVKNHMTEVLLRLEARSRAHAVAVAKDMGLI